MAKYLIEPICDPGNGDGLPCTEADATHWAVVIDHNTRHIFESREDAEARVEKLERADRFTWGPDDVEHH